MQIFYFYRETWMLCLTYQDEHFSKNVDIWFSAHDTFLE